MDIDARAIESVWEVGFLNSTANLPMSIESQLREKLRKIEALFPGAGTAGDRLGAEQFRSPQVEEPCHHGGGPGGLSVAGSLPRMSSSTSQSAANRDRLRRQPRAFLHMQFVDRLLTWAKQAASVAPSLAPAPLATAIPSEAQDVCDSIDDLASATLLGVAPGTAQRYDPVYPFCLQKWEWGGSSTIYCSYTSWDQCWATASGLCQQCAWQTHIGRKPFQAVKGPMQAAGPHLSGHPHPVE